MIFFLLVKGEAPLDGDEATLLSQIKGSFDECLGIVHAVGEFDYDFHDDDRRRNVVTKARKKMTVCGKVAKVAATFSRDYFTLSRGVLGRLQSSESSFLKDMLREVHKKMGDVLYVASVDGDAVSKFHSLCDNQGPTIVVVETTAGVLFGGFASVSWTSKGTWHTSSTSFLFQIRPAMKKFRIKTAGRNYATYNAASYGPTFGGHDLYIGSGAMSNSNSYVNLGSYQASSTYELNDGTKRFKVKDYVVLKAVSL